MKKLVFIVAVAMLSVSFGAARAAAQGPQGAGAGSASSSSSSGTHSLNPIKWVKKEPKSASDTARCQRRTRQEINSQLARARSFAGEHGRQERLRELQGA